MDKLLNHMTETQARRWRMLLDGETVYQIAKIEGRHWKTIKESLESGKKRAKKRVKKPPIVY